MRNRGYWHGIHKELLQEKRRPVKPEEVQDRLRTIQKKGVRRHIGRVSHEYNNKRIAAGLSPVKDGGPFKFIHELKSGMEEKLVVPITWFSWEIYMCLLYVELKHTSRTRQGFQIKE